MSLELDIDDVSDMRYRFRRRWPDDGGKRRYRQFLTHGGRPEGLARSDDGGS